VGDAPPAADTLSVDEPRSARHPGLHRGTASPADSALQLDPGARPLASSRESAPRSSGIQEQDPNASEPRIRPLTDRSHAAAPPVAARQASFAREASFARQVGAVRPDSARQMPFALQLDPALSSPSPTDGPISAELDHLDLLDQIGAAIRRTEAQFTSEARPPALSLSRVTVTLHPPDLGAIHIAVESRSGDLAADRLAAHFHSTQPLVHAWLESNAPALRSHLSGVGLHFQDLSFSTTTHDHSGGSPADHRDGFVPPPPPEPARPPADGEPVPLGPHHQASGWLA